jgi:hypothetical protein
MVMESETHANDIFKVENCRARNGAVGLVDCLSPQQAHLCGSSMRFGNGYFCKHPHRNKFIEITKKLQGDKPLPDVSHSDDHE